MKMVLLLAEMLVCVHSVQMIQTLCAQGHQADGSLRLFVPGLTAADIGPVALCLLENLF